MALNPAQRCTVPTDPALSSRTDQESFGWRVHAQDFLVEACYQYLKDDIFFQYQIAADPPPRTVFDPQSPSRFAVRLLQRTLSVLADEPFDLSELGYPEPAARCRLLQFCFFVVDALYKLYEAGLKQYADRNGGFPWWPLHLVPRRHVDSQAVKWPADYVPPQLTRVLGGESLLRKAHRIAALILSSEVTRTGKDPQAGELTFPGRKILFRQLQNAHRKGWRATTNWLQPGFGMPATEATPESTHPTETMPVTGIQLSLNLPPEGVVRSFLNEAQTITSLPLLLSEGDRLSAAHGHYRPPNSDTVVEHFRRTWGRAFQLERGYIRRWDFYSVGLPCPAYALEWIRKKGFRSL